MIFLLVCYRFKTQLPHAVSTKRKKFFPYLSYSGVAQITKTTNTLVKFKVNYFIYKPMVEKKSLSFTDINSAVAADITIP